MLEATEGAGAIAARVRAGERSAAEVLQEHLERIERLNGTLNAIVLPDLDRADAAAAAGPAGPLAGVPFTVKEAIDVEGLPGCEASRLRPNTVATRDAPVVARLRAAGAVLVGKTNVSELCAHPDSCNLMYGDTRNPVDQTRSAGGSSGGEGAAVAAGFSAFGVGSDYGGSIRAPAHFCGVAGIRPGVGRVPSDGHLPPVKPDFRGRWSTLGPLARSVADLELVLSVLAGERVGFAALPSRVGVFVDALDRPVSRACAGAVAAAAAALPCDVVEVVPPFQTAAERLYDAVSAAETRGIVGGLTGLDAASPQLRLVWGAVRNAAPLGGDEQTRLRGIEAEAAEWMDAYPVLLAPAAAEPAFALGSLRPDVFDLFHHCKLASTLGLPAAVIPVGSSAAGLPVGVQVIGRRGREDEVLAVCRAIEAAIGEGGAA